tara:strand:- start:3581 stop:4237 length:657 start_codon:yes stop_codon:yes gene_type:complete
MTDQDRKVNRYIQGLFQNGLEGYDATQKNTPSKGVVDAGGAKVFFHQNFRTPQSSIIINHKGLDRAIKDAPVVVYALNRIELDDEGEPQKVDGGGYRRIFTGLMLYTEYEDEEGTLTQGIRDRLVESVKEANLNDYIEVGSKVVDPEGKLNVLSQLKHQNFARDLVPLATQNCIFLALPSGAPGSSQFWSFRNMKSQDRGAMSRSVTASSVETDDIPF